MPPSKSVLVIGGGIAGMQSTLDLAEKGIKVYLVERTPSVGGRMAQLDKTFPTNDCSICILSPKMAECSMNPNITPLTYSELKEVSGGVGKFKVKILKKARYVDEKKCTGCGDCTKNCPVELANEFELGMSLRKAIYRLFPQAVPNKFTIDKKGISPCRNACPAGVNAQGYTALISQGKFKEALALIREKNPFPGICGRVCHHPCEEDCNRKEVDEPIAIAALKRFIADYELKLKEPTAHAEITKHKKIAIIGSGPAGLTCAYYLTKMGYSTTVFEALPVAGGMLAVAIPEYRLPRQILQAEIEHIKRLGVEIKTNTKIESLAALKGYDAVFIAAGAHESRKLNVPGEELKGVVHGVSFLKELNLGKKVKVGNRVAVIGGGNVAIDSARAALRSGAKEVFILYRRSRAEMPANDWEIQEAEEEGVKINYLAAPTKLIGKDGKVAGIECMKMELGEADESGRRKPVPIKGSEFVIDVDMVIPAIGQFSDTEFLKDKLKLSENGTVVVDGNTLATSGKGIFAGGDLTRGPATVVEAIADGYQAAFSIEKYLGGESLGVKEERHVVGIEEVDTKAVAKRARMKQLQQPAQERIKDFSEVNLSLTEQEAIEEAKRCLNCAVCSECKECEKACEPKAIVHDQKEELLELEVGAIIVATGFEPYLPYELTEYGYGKHSDVLTALEYERILSASGPTGGHVVRRSDQKKPKTIAFIQCVGSRDMQHDHPYCCAVCCMHATKEAMITKEHEKDIDCYVFYTDLRALSKGFQEYVDRARNEYGIKYIRAKPGKVARNSSNTLRVGYEDTATSELRTLDAGLIVLATTLLPRKDVKEIASVLGIELNGHGFFKIPNPLYAPVDTTRAGIFVAGYCEAPKDIPESVAQGSAAAARAAEIIYSATQDSTLKSSPKDFRLQSIIKGGGGK